MTNFNNEELIKSTKCKSFIILSYSSLHNRSLTNRVFFVLLVRYIQNIASLRIDQSALFFDS